MYSCTFNDNTKSNTQKAILFELPSQEDLDQFAPIKILLAPPGCKEVIFIPGTEKEYYFDRGFKEISVTCTPHRVHILPNNMQGVRMQYGLQHYVAGTIHSIMGDTLPSLATTFSNSNRDYGMWDKGQLLVIISRTKLAENTIFVGEKSDTLDALESILKNRTQWTDHMENILQVVTINHEENENQRNNLQRGEMDHSSFPYQPSQVSLPTDASGYVYMLISLRQKDYFYIGKTFDLHQRLRAHQSGYGSISTQPEHLRPYAYFAFVCGFDGNNSLMYYLESKWKESVVRIRNRGIRDARIWAAEGGNDLLNLNLSNFGIDDTRNELRLVCLFK